VVAAITIFHFLMTKSTSMPGLFWTVVAGAAGLLLCAGLWTPIAGGVVSVFALWSTFSPTRDCWALILLAAVGAALAMLGPGAWSVDARLFGRKRLIHEP
jgi:uncharacterized membrane protein YphA (DoxX/SURF4 family)